MLRGAKQTRRRFLAASLITLAAAPLGMLACSDLQSGRTTAADPATIKDNTAMQQITPVAISLPVEGELPSLGGATAGSPAECGERA
jgi:hypothetical protein